MLTVFAKARSVIWGVITPANTSMPRRYWRWLWAAMAFRLLIALPLVTVLFVPYAVSLCVTASIDWLGGKVGNVYVSCHNRDLKRSGWRPPKRLVPALQINPDWPKSA